jgi:hypothetical protein
LRTDSERLGHARIRLWRLESIALESSASALHFTLPSMASASFPEVSCTTSSPSRPTCRFCGGSHRVAFPGRTDIIVASLGHSCGSLRPVAAVCCVRFCVALGSHAVARSRSSCVTRKRLDDSLPPDWQRVDEAFQAGRVSDEIFPGWKVPTYYEAQQKADDVIRSQFERARREYGG